MSVAVKISALLMLNQYSFFVIFLADSFFLRRKLYWTGYDWVIKKSPSEGMLREGIELEIGIFIQCYPKMTLF